MYIYTYYVAPGRGGGGGGCSGVLCCERGVEYGGHGVAAGEKKQAEGVSDSRQQLLR